MQVLYLKNAIPLKQHFPYELLIHTKRKLPDSTAVSIITHIIDLTDQKLQSQKTIPNQDERKVR